VLAYIENLTYNRFNLFARDRLWEEARSGAEFKRKNAGFANLDIPFRARHQDFDLNNFRKFKACSNALWGDDQV
jgi:hypothetical protein